MIVNSTMGIFKFFRKFKDVFHRTKDKIINVGGKAFGKFISPVVNVIKKTTGFIDKTPLGPILSKMTGGIYDTAKKVISYLPDGTVKDNASKFADKAKDAAGSAISRVEQIQEKAKDWMNRGKNMKGAIVHGLKNGPANGIKMSFGFDGANM
jgi:hypothetical protein